MTADALRLGNLDMGLYRVPGDNLHTLLYFGQGRISDRLFVHLAMRWAADHPQGKSLTTDVDPNGVKW